MAYSYYTPMYQQNYNPYQYQSQATPQPPQNATQNQASILWVRNGQDAAMYPVAPNSAVALWDSGSPVIYLKQADAAGKPSMKTYDLVERVEKPTENAPQQDNSVFATKSELAALAGVVKDVDGVISALREEVEALKKVPVKRAVKKEAEDDG